MLGGFSSGHRGIRGSGTTPTPWLGLAFSWGSKGADQGRHAWTLMSLMNLTPSSAQPGLTHAPRFCSCRGARCISRLLRQLKSWGQGTVKVLQGPQDLRSPQGGKCSMHGAKSHLEAEPSNPGAPIHLPSCRERVVCRCLVVSGEAWRMNAVACRSSSTVLQGLVQEPNGSAAGELRAPFQLGTCSSAGLEGGASGDRPGHSAAQLEGGGRR